MHPLALFLGVHAPRDGPSAAVARLAYGARA